MKFYPRERKREEQREREEAHGGEISRKGKHPLVAAFLSLLIS